VAQLEPPPARIGVAQLLAFTQLLVAWAGP
jgi:hypothetical protein